MCEVTKALPDDSNKVRNVEVMVKPKQSGSGPYISTRPIFLNRHVNNLIVLEPADEQVKDLGELHHGPQHGATDVQQEGQVVQEQEID